MLCLKPFGSDELPVYNKGLRQRGRQDQVKMGNGLHRWHKMC